MKKLIATLALAASLALTGCGDGKQRVVEWSDVSTLSPEKYTESWWDSDRAHYRAHLLDDKNHGYLCHISVPTGRWIERGRIFCSRVIEPAPNQITLTYEEFYNE